MYYRNYVQIDLDAIEYNINSVSKKIGDAKLLVVVKADAYGHGAVEVSKTIEDKCDFFGVASVDEALELINNGIKNPILILGYVSPKSFDDIVKHNIRIPIFSYDTAKALSDEAIRQNKIVDFHFCIDTGMSRIGFQVNEESADICEKIAKLPNINAQGLFSHFATADEKDLSKTLAQKEKFVSFMKMLQERGINIPIKHLCNSAGIMNFDEHFDMVRSGIVTYGLYPSKEVNKSLLDIKPALQWKSSISHIKTLESGREVSYGGTYTTQRDTVVATIPVGYADGYPRCLSNKGKVIINGCFANIIGRVCMDQLMVDVTDIDGVEVDDEVTLVGRNGNLCISVEDVADSAYSFNYELPCRINRRVPRVYTKDGKIVNETNYLY